MQQLTWVLWQKLPQTTTASSICHPGTLKWSLCLPPTSLPESGAQCQNGRSRCELHHQEEVSCLRWSGHWPVYLRKRNEVIHCATFFTGNFINIQGVFAYYYNNNELHQPRCNKISLITRTKGWPGTGSLTRLKMVPGRLLMLKHRASFLSGSSIMKWGSPSTRDSNI